MMRAAAIAWCVVAIGAGAARAQTQPPEELTFDRPEAWAMKYFTSASALNGLSTPDETEPGSIGVAFESGWLPALSTSQERVGFNGTTPEDLNKAPVFLRPRITIGLAHGLAVIAAFDPPIRSFNVTPRLFALGLDGTIHDGRQWRVGWRAHGQLGSVTAAVTCPSSTIAFVPGSPGNPAGCTAESADQSSLRYAGAEVHVARRLANGLSPHAAIGVNFVDTIFQTNAQTFGQPDHTRLTTRGLLFAGSAGIGYVFASRFAIAADLFYSPLTVRRSPGASRTIDPMMNARALVSYRIIR
jgi:hypothetical protein